MSRRAAACLLALVLAGCGGAPTPRAVPSASGGAASGAAWPGLFRDRQVTLRRVRQRDNLSDRNPDGSLMVPSRRELGHEVICEQRARRDGGWAWSRLVCRSSDDALGSELEAGFVTDGVQLWRAPAGVPVRDRRDAARIAGGAPFMPAPLVEASEAPEDGDGWQRVEDDDGAWCLLTRRAEASDELTVCVHPERGVTLVRRDASAEGEMVADWFEQVPR